MVELSWEDAPRGPGESFRLYRGGTPSDIGTLLTPPEYTGRSFVDAGAPSLAFYSLRLANCAGVVGPP